MKLLKSFIVVLFLLNVFALAVQSDAAIFRITSAKLYFTKGNNRLIINGKIAIGSIDLTANDLTIQVGSYSLTVEAGSFSKSGKKYIISDELLAMGFPKIILDLKAKTFSVTASGIDLSGTENPVNISITIGDSYSECATLKMKKITKRCFMEV